MLFQKRKSAFWKFPNPCKISLVPGMSLTHHMPSTATNARNIPTSAQELGEKLTPFPGEEGGSENCGFCCFSCKHALGSYPFPFPSLLHSVTNSAARRPFPIPAQLMWPIFQANFKQELKVSTLASWGNFKGILEY